ncbi:MAG TPA: hypothetical protein VKT80_14360 [Chloroflexota bacterium]|nr:hypothetical protein [Chloroflexota bacterium]
MYLELEQKVVRKLTSALPPLYYEQRDQFVRTLPLLAIVSVVFVVVLGGWLNAPFALVRALASANSFGAFPAASPVFWLLFLPPVFWLVSILPLRERRLAGWRLFVVGTFLSLVGSLVTLNLFNILFSAAILYFTVLCYDEFYRR